MSEKGRAPSNLTDPRFSAGSRLIVSLNHRCWGGCCVDGTPFGRYRLIELIGRGGMGEVWRVYDTDTDRIVAIKVLPARFSDNEDFKQ